VQWLRNGVAIPGADRATYRTTAADLGARLAARVTRTRAGYSTLVSNTMDTAPIRSVPTVRLTTQPGRGLVRVAVTVVAAGTSPVAGRLRVVTWHGKVSRQLTLHRGTASTTLRGIPAGLRRVRVTYLGSSRVTSRLVTRLLRVR
jgi:hypothetical protein